MKNKIKKIGRIILGIGTLYILSLIYPNPLFSYEYQYRNFVVYSDSKISENIKFVLDDAIQRIENSELYEPKDKFNLYLCNEDWRFRFFTRNGNAGGVVNFLFSSNIFIRKNDLENNQLIPPQSWTNPLTDRPLSYFIAHESVHCLQRKYDKFLIFKVKVEIIEGYAEYVAKQKTNEISKLIMDYRDNSSTMNPKNGLYDKYNLYVTYLIEDKKYSFDRIVKEQPNLEETLNLINE